MTKRRSTRHDRLLAINNKRAYLNRALWETRDFVDMHSPILQTFRASFAQNKLRKELTDASKKH